MPQAWSLTNSQTWRILDMFYHVLIAYLKFLSSLFLGSAKKNIKGQNVLITGGGGGLGREMALKLASKGANLILVDMNEKNLKCVKDEILHQEGINVQVLDYVVDIRSDVNVRELGRKIRSDIGDVDILINNAGIVQCLPFLELSPELVERTFQVNSLAHMWTIREFLPRMMAKNSGHIVAISSIAGLIGNKYLTDYCASKFAVVGLMEALEKEFHDRNEKNYDGIHFTTVCPSSMTTKMFQTFTSRFDWLLPVMRPENVAQIIVDSILENRRMVIIPKIAQIFHKLSMFVPTEASNAVEQFLDYGVKPHAY